MTEWRTDTPPNNKWLKVWVACGSCEPEGGHESRARYSNGHWTMAENEDVWGPILCWRYLEGEKP